MLHNHTSWESETACPQTGLGGSGAGNQMQSSQAFHTERMTWECFPSQPGGPAVPLWPWQHPPAPLATGFISPEMPMMGSLMVVLQACHSWLRWISNSLNTTNVLKLDSDRSKPVNNETFVYHQSDTLHVTSVLAVLCIFLDVSYAVFCIPKVLIKFWIILEYQ